ncbi:hypothetical protein G6541_08315 [Streptomyces albidoflavus]|nr:hypothetical protein [Streptomyces albidoflavus]
MTHTIGQRIRTTINLVPMWEGGFSAPAGTLGTVTGLPVGPGDSYSVVIDGEPDAMPLSLHPDEFTAA